jgi:hypothetical protein
MQMRSILTIKKTKSLVHNYSDHNMATTLTLLRTIYLGSIPHNQVPKILPLLGGYKLEVSWTTDHKERADCMARHDEKTTLWYYMPITLCQVILGKDHTFVNLPHDLLAFERHHYFPCLWILPTCTSELTRYMYMESVFLTHMHECGCIPYHRFIPRDSCSS